jgi:alkylation response protein AidB-like acyl-CoA dehydrogenase
MDFGFTEEQEALRKSAREFLTDRSTTQLVRDLMASKTGFDETLWKEMSDLGWMGTAIAESDGGLGLSLIELAVLVEEMGRALLPSPFYSSVGLAAPVIAATAEGALRKTVLGGIASGDLRATVALAEAEGRWDAAGVKAKATRVNGGYKLSGTKVFVPDAHLADEIVVVARTSKSKDPREGISLFLVPTSDKKMKVRQLDTIDATRRLCQVKVGGVEVPAERRLGPEGEAWPLLERALDRAATVLSAEATGLATKVLELSRDYAKERTQFDKPIGAFQAISHRIADMLVLTENARSTTYYAAWALEEGVPDAALAAATAKVAASEAARVVAQDGIQVHGGIGFTWEHDMHLYYRRAKWCELFLGDPSIWRERVASLFA